MRRIFPVLSTKLGRPFLWLCVVWGLAAAGLVALGFGSFLSLSDRANQALKARDATEQAALKANVAQSQKIDALEQTLREVLAARTPEQQQAAIQHAKQLEAESRSEPSQRSSTTTTTRPTPTTQPSPATTTTQPRTPPTIVCVTVVGCR